MSNDETGEPIVELADLEEETSAGFFSRILNAIERRSFASNLLAFVWHVPIMILMEFLKLVFEFVNPPKGRGETPSDGKTP